MSVDLSKLRVGDSIRLRGGRVEVVDRIGPVDRNFYKWCINDGYYYSNDGRVFEDNKHHADIVEIIPKKEKEEAMSVDLSKLQVGDSVQLRSGRVEVVDRIGPVDRNFYKWCINDGYYYSNDGRCYLDIENPSDIVEIIPKIDGSITDFIEYMRDTAIAPLNDQAATLRKVANELRCIGGMEGDATKYTIMANTYDHAAETVRAAILAWGEDE